MTTPISSPLYLASASPRRHDILVQMSIPHEVLLVPSPPGEDEPRLPKETPLDYVQRTALDKLQHALNWRREQAALDQELAILSADTTVALEDDILGKPCDAAQAQHYLQRLSGSCHQVMTAVCLAHEGKIYQTLSISEVEFKTLSLAEIQFYCASGEPFGKAGGYGIQGAGGMFVRHLRGSYSAVVGLPMHETYELLNQAKLITL